MRLILSDRPEKGQENAEGDKMTPPMPECPASSELLASSSRSQGISGGGVRNGALLAPLCLQCSSETANLENAGVRDPLLHFRGRSRGVRENSIFFSDLQSAQPWDGDEDLDDPEVPKQGHQWSCLGTMPKECRQSEKLAGILSCQAYDLA